MLKLSSLVLFPLIFCSWSLAAYDGGNAGLLAQENPWEPVRPLPFRFENAATAKVYDREDGSQVLGLIAADYVTEQYTEKIPFAEQFMAIVTDLQTGKKREESYELTRFKYEARTRLNASPKRLEVPIGDVKGWALDGEALTPEQLQQNFATPKRCFVSPSPEYSGDAFYRDLLEDGVSVIHYDVNKAKAFPIQGGAAKPDAANLWQPGEIPNVGLDSVGAGIVFQDAGGRDVLGLVQFEWAQVPVTRFRTETRTRSVKDEDTGENREEAYSVQVPYQVKQTKLVRRRIEVPLAATKLWTFRGKLLSAEIAKQGLSTARRCILAPSHSSKSSSPFAYTAKPFFREMVKNDVLVVSYDPSSVSPVTRSVTPKFTGPESLDGLQLTDLPTYASLEGQEVFKRFFDWQKKILVNDSAGKSGHLVVGRVELEGGGNASVVNSQDWIRNDGAFAHRTGDLEKPFGLRAHGFEAIDVQLTECEGGVVDVGTIRMNRVPPVALRRLKGRIALEGSGDLRTVTVELEIDSGPMNLSGGFRSGADRIPIPLGADGAFNVGGFSPTKYNLRVFAAGYVDKSVPVDFREADSDVGVIRLLRKKAVLIERVAAAEDGRFESNAVESLESSGGDYWRGQNESRSFATLYFRQEDAGFLLRPAGRMTLQDLGEGRLEDFLDADRSETTERQALPAVKGHVYLLHAQRMKQHLLFRVNDIVEYELTTRTVVPSVARPVTIESARLTSLQTYQRLENREALEKSFEAAKRTLQRDREYWSTLLLVNYTGHIVVGKVELEDQEVCTEVQAQGHIASDGTFAMTTQSLWQPLGFRLHQYEPVDIVLRSSQGGVIDAGTIRMRRLPPAELKSLSGKVTLEGEADASAAKIELRIAIPTLNSPRGRNSGLRGKKIAVEVDQDGTISADGFSPTEYYCTISAPGFVSQKIKTDFARIGGADLGVIKLKKQPK